MRRPKGFFALFYKAVHLRRGLGATAKPPNMGVNFALTHNLALSVKPI